MLVKMILLSKDRIEGAHTVEMIRLYCYELSLITLLALGINALQQECLLPWPGYSYNELISCIIYFLAVNNVLERISISLL